MPIQNSLKMILNRSYKILNYKHVLLKNKVGLNLLFYLNEEHIPEIQFKKQG